MDRAIVANIRVNALKICSVLFFHKTQQEKRSISKIEDKDLESIQSSAISDQGYQWESNKLTIRHYKREPRGKPFPSR